MPGKGERQEVPKEGLKLLFTPVKIGQMKLKNRLVMPPMGTRYSAFGGWVTERLIQYYVERARGGVGLIIVENAGVTLTGRGSHHTLGIYDDRLIPGLRKLSYAVQEAGAKVAIQLAHSGAGATSAVMGVQPVAPSPIPRFQGEVPRELSIDEIEDLIKAFAHAARRAKEAGFNAVELHMAHGYLLNQFLSPLTNKRTDKYGGDITGRARFALEVLQRVKETVGDEFPVLCRLSADEFVKGGLTLEESRIIAKMLEDAGADAIDVTGGIAETFYMSAPPMALPAGCLVHLAEGIKEAVSVPVIAVGKIRDPLLAERILREEKADLVAVGRGLIADPEFPTKAVEGRFDDIRPCISCNRPECHGRLSRGLDLNCLVNPAVGRETTFRLRPAERPRKILVAGGGPAGMEAARIAALRGHQVILCEKSDQLGGQFILAAVPPHKEEISKFTGYLIRQLNRLGVEIRLNCAVSAGMVEEMRPDAVIAATGAVPLIPEIDGARANAVTAWDVLAGKVMVGSEVVVVGGGDIGCEVGEYLARQGRQVTILEMLPEAAPELVWWTRKLLFDRLAAYGVQVLTKARVVAIEKDRVVYDRDGITNNLEWIDTVVLAVGAVPNNELVAELRDRGMEVYPVGDCVEPRTGVEAIREGFEVAFAL